MSLSKLKQIHVIIIGSFLCVVAGVGMFFLMIKPQMDELKKVEARIVAAQPTGTQENVDRANRQLQEATAKVANAQQALDAQMRQRMPDLSFEQRDRGMIAYWQEIKVTSSLLNGFVKDGNVSSVQANFTLPDPPWNPNDPIFDQDLITIPLGQVAASGDFNSLMNNIRRWNNCRRLIMVGPPSLVMGGEELVSSYAVTCYVFPVAKGGEQIKMAGTPGAAGAAGVPGGMPPAPMPAPMPAPAPGQQ